MNKLTLFSSAVMMLATSTMTAKNVYLSSTGSDSNDGLSPENAVATLSKALEVADAANDHIVISGFITVSSGLTTARPLTFEGANGAATDGFVGGTDNNRLFRLGGNQSTTFKNITVKNFKYAGADDGQGDLKGIIFFAGGTYTFEGCAFEGNTNSQSEGGILRTHDAKVVIDNCVFKNNTSFKGGIIRKQGGNDVIVTNTLFEENKAGVQKDGDAKGGVIYAVEGWKTLSFTGCTFKNNVAIHNGGVFCVSANDNQQERNFLVEDCVFEGNRSGVFEGFARESGVYANNYWKDGNGGVIYFDKQHPADWIDKSVYTIKNSSFKQNVSGGFGGAIAVNNAKLTLVIDGCIFEDNKSLTTGGGALYIKNITGKSTVKNSKFLNNTAATGTGTRAGVNDTAAGGYKDDYVSGVYYANGGAILFAGTSNIEVDNCVFSGNAAYQNGGALRISDGTTETTLIKNSTFTGNMVGGRLGTFNPSDYSSSDWILTTTPGNGRDEDKSGAAILIESANMAENASFTLVGCTFEGNSATNSGGAIRFGDVGKSGQSLNIINCTITDNEVVRHGAGNGAGIWVNNSAVTHLNITNSILDGNRYFSKKDEYDGYNDAKWDNAPANIKNSYIGSINDWGMETKYVGNNTTTVDALSVLNETGQGKTDRKGGLRTKQTTEFGHVYFPLTIGTKPTTIGASSEASGYQDILGVAFSKNYIGSAQVAELPFTVSEYGYATLYYGTDPLEVPSGLTATTYKVESDVLNVSKTYSAGEVIPAGTGVVIAGTQGDYVFASTFETGTADAENQLKGSDEDAETTGGTKYYKLSVKEGKNPGFYWGKDNGAAFTNGAHKAYLTLKSASSRSAFVFGNNTTAIEQTVSTTAAASDMYDMQGRRLISRPSKGLYIIRSAGSDKNGKKIIIK